MARIDVIEIQTPGLSGGGLTQTTADTLYEAKASNTPAANQYLAHIAGQRVWIKMPHVDPSASAYGLSTSGTEANNATALGNAATDAVSAGLPLLMPIGEFPLAGNVTLPSGILLDGKGSDRSVFTRTTGGSTPTLKVTGTLGTQTPLSADAAVDSRTVTTTTNPGLAAGDLVRLYSTRVVGTSSGAVGYELARVASVSGTGPYTVTLQGALMHAFATVDSATIAKVTPCTAKLTGFGIRVSGGLDARGITVTYGKDVVVGDYATGGYATWGVDFAACIDSTVDTARIDDPSNLGGGFGYGVLFRQGTRDSLMEGITGHGNRHMTIMTEAASRNTVRRSTGRNSPSGDFDQHGCESRYNVYEDCHSESDFWGFVAGNTSYGADYDTTYTRCTGRGNPSGRGHFSAVQGAARIIYSDCRTDGGDNGILFQLGAKEIEIRGGRFRNHVRGIRGIDTVGVQVDGAVVENSSEYAIRSDLASNWWSLLGTQYVNCAFAHVLAGANNTTANTISR